MKEEIAEDYEGRIMIDKGIKEGLDEIKDNARYIRYNQGHKETVKFLIKHYNDTMSIRAEVERAMKRIENTVKNSVFEAFKNFFSNLFKAAVS